MGRSTMATWSRPSPLHLPCISPHLPYISPASPLHLPCISQVVSAISAGMATGMPQADGSSRVEPRMEATDAADAVYYMASLPLSANVLAMTVMATNMPLVGRG